VVAELLRSYGKDRLEIVDAREFVPHFRCRPGLSHWLVLDDAPGKDKSVQPSDTSAVDGEGASHMHPELPDANAQTSTSPHPLVSECSNLGMRCYASVSDVPPHRQHRIRNTIFPPSQEEAEWMHLG